MDSKTRDPALAIPREEVERVVWFEELVTDQSSDRSRRKMVEPHNRSPPCPEGGSQL